MLSDGETLTLTRNDDDKDLFQAACSTLPNSTTCVIICICLFIIFDLSFHFDGLRKRKHMKLTQYKYAVVAYTSEVLKSHRPLGLR